MTKKIFWTPRMRFYIACSACSSHWDKLQMPPKPPKCRHQVYVCADQLLSWRCITVPNGKSGGPLDHEIRQGVVPPPIPIMHSSDVALNMDGALMQSTVAYTRLILVERRNVSHRKKGNKENNKNKILACGRIYLCGRGR